MNAIFASSADSGGGFPATYFGDDDVVAAVELDDVLDFVVADVVAEPEFGVTDGTVTVCN
jgi:hypothetical protein